MVDYMKKVATENNIKWQPEILTAGGTDTAPIQRMSTLGSIAGAVSVPTRHIHQVIEMVNKEDVVNCIELLKVSVENIDKYDWEFK
jgi:endoglucanase